MCAYLVLRDKVIKPLLAGVVRPLGRPPKNPNPLDHHPQAVHHASVADRVAICTRVNLVSRHLTFSEPCGTASQSHRRAGIGYAQRRRLMWPPRSNRLRSTSTYMRLSSMLHSSKYRLHQGKPGLHFLMLQCSKCPPHSKPRRTCMMNINQFTSKASFPIRPDWPSPPSRGRACVSHRSRSASTAC